MVVRPLPFEAMEQSLDKETVGMPDDVGISISLWKLKVLMAGYRWFLDHNKEA